MKESNLNASNYMNTSTGAGLEPNPEPNSTKNPDPIPSSDLNSAPTSHPKNRKIQIAMLITLIVAIVFLIIAILIPKDVFLGNSEDGSKSMSAELETILAEIEQQYHTSPFSREGAVAFNAITRKKAQNGEYSAEEIFNRYEEIIHRTEDAVKLDYLYYYTIFHLEETQDLYSVYTS